MVQMARSTDAIGTGRQLVSSFICWNANAICIELWAIDGRAVKRLNAGECVRASLRPVSRSNWLSVCRSMWRRVSRAVIMQMHSDFELNCVRKCNEMKSNKKVFPFMKMRRLNTRQRHVLFYWWIWFSALSICELRWVHMALYMHTDNTFSFYALSSWN